jgi:hypothetical protein
MRFVFWIIFKDMDKRSFNLLFAFVAASMVVIGTYKMAKKKSQVQSAPTSVKTNK